MESIFSLHVCCSDSTADKAQPHLALAGTELCLSERRRSAGQSEITSKVLAEPICLICSAASSARSIHQPGQTHAYCSDNPAAPPEIAEFQRPWDPEVIASSIQLSDLLSCFKLDSAGRLRPYPTLPFPSWPAPSFFLPKLTGLVEQKAASLATLFIDFVYPPCEAAPSLCHKQDLFPFFKRFINRSLCSCRHD